MLTAICSLTATRVSRKLVVMLSDLELGWLAGILDGEGSIYCRSAHAGPDRCKKHTISMPCPRISVQNTSKVMIVKLGQILAKMGVRHKIGGPFWRIRSTKEVYRIDVCRKPDQLKLLSVIGPHLVSKNKQGRLVYRWLEKWKCCSGRGKVTPPDSERAIFIQALCGLNAA